MQHVFFFSDNPIAPGEKCDLSDHWALPWLDMPDLQIQHAAQVDALSCDISALQAGPTVQQLGSTWIWYDRYGRFGAFLCIIWCWWAFLWSWWSCHPSWFFLSGLVHASSEQLERPGEKKIWEKDRSWIKKHKPIIPCWIRRVHFFPSVIFFVRGVHGSSSRPQSQSQMKNMHIVSQHIAGFYIRAWF